MTSDTCQLAPISPFFLGSAGLYGYGGGTSDSYEIASFLGLKLAFRGLNGLFFHNPGAFWALLSLPRGHLRSNTLWSTARRRGRRQAADISRRFTSRYMKNCSDTILPSLTS